MASLPTDLIPLALSYDWLGRTIYLAGRNTTVGNFAIWNFKLRTAVLQLLFERQLDDDVQVTMVMNPFTG